jgi:hypothetical protein
MKQRPLKDYLHFYVGCECIIGDLNWKPQDIAPHDLVPYTDPDFGKPIRCKMDLHTVQQYSHKITPVLRPLSDMKEKEMIELLKILFSDVEDKINDDELQDMEMFYWDNACMVDGDIQVGANFSCRCFEGQIAIRECGSIFLFDEGGDQQRLSNTPEAMRYLLSLGFDLFKLIPAELAIDKTQDE